LNRESSAATSNSDETPKPTAIVNEKIAKLKFPTQRTAFDGDIDAALETHPWRKRTANLSYYFNYGFYEEKKPKPDIHTLFEDVVLYQAISSSRARSGTFRTRSEISRSLFNRRSL
jgi:hypothetical protein